MNASDHAECVRRLDSALRQIGLSVDEGVRQGGSIVAWEPVSTERLLARWLSMAWRIRPVSADLDAPRLTLVDSSTVADEEAGA